MILTNTHIMVVVLLHVGIVRVSARVPIVWFRLGCRSFTGFPHFGNTQVGKLSHVYESSDTLVEAFTWRLLCM